MANSFRLPFMVDLKEWGSFHPGLERIFRVLDLLGNPHHDFPHVVVGGTNGKGTVSYNLSLIAPQPCGLFISPHLVNWQERATIAGQWFDDQQWLDAYEHVASRIGAIELSYFEWFTILGILLFQRAGVKFAVLEIGLGGRLDSVNSFDPILSILTNVSLDHTELLGDTIESIALEKIEIARTGRPFLLPASIYSIPKVLNRLNAIGCQCIPYRDQGTFDDNLLLVNEAADLLGLPAVGKVALLPGRQEFLSAGAGIYLDGGHNEAGWIETARWLSTLNGGPFNFLVGVSKGRDPQRFLELLEPFSENIYLWPYENEKRLSLEMWPKRLIRTDTHFFPELLNKPLVVCGSLYAVGAFKSWLNDFTCSGSG